MKRFFYAATLLLGLCVVFSSCDKSGTDTDGADASGAVDLGLSVKWASCNLGASKPEEFGDYYAWGETSPKREYSLENYKFYVGKSKTASGHIDEQYSKYVALPEEGTVDNKVKLDLSDDAAHVILGGKWRMPTMEECMELVNKCIWTYQNRMGVFGFEVKSSVNGNSIFLPLAGWFEDELYEDNESGGYWSSTLDIEQSGWALYLYMDEDYDIDEDTEVRWVGGSIRPVKGK